MIINRHSSLPDPATFTKLGSSWLGRGLYSHATSTTKLGRGRILALSSFLDSFHRVFGFYDLPRLVTPHSRPASTAPMWETIQPCRMHDGAGTQHETRSKSLFRLILSIPSLPSSSDARHTSIPAGTYRFERGGSLYSHEMCTRKLEYPSILISSRSLHSHRSSQALFARERQFDAH